MNSLASAELLTIAALTKAVAAKPSPDLHTLLRFLKEAHQTAYAQVTFLRLAEKNDRPPTVVALPAPDKVREFLTALRGIEDQWTACYRDSASSQDGSAKEILGGLADRALQRATLLTAHLAASQAGTTEIQRLPLPLVSYLADSTSKACMRCMVDRPGTRPSIKREDPTTYICAACHDEVRLAFPPELQPLIDTWPEKLRESRIVEKALSPPSKEKAKNEIHPVLAGLTPKLTRPVVRKIPMGNIGPSGPVDPPVASELNLAAAPSAEQAYLEEIFDPRRMQRRW